MDPIPIHDLLPQIQSLLSSLPAPNPITSPLSAPVLPSRIPPLNSHTLSLPSRGLNLSPFPHSSSNSLPPLLDHLKNQLLPFLSSSSLSPHYYGFITGGSTPASLAADILVSIFDQNAAVHLPNDSIATNIEVAALNLLIDLFNLPTRQWQVGRQGCEGGGVFTTGATASNIVGLAAGREWTVRERMRRSRANQGQAEGEQASIAQVGILEACQRAGVKQIKILSTLPHSSISKACAVLGLGRDSVISLLKDETPNDKSKATISRGVLDIDVDKLERMVSRGEEDATVYIVVISAGEVNTGHFATTKPVMQRIREICDKFGIWIHVDGAFGLFARLLMGCKDEEHYSHLIAGGEGLELADSITTDCHKLLNVPYDCGVLFTRHKKILESVFTNGNAAYLTSGSVEDQGEERIQSPSNIGLENSRRFRALPVYATLVAYGREGYVDMLKRQIGLARKVAGWLFDHDEYHLLPVQGKEESKEEMLKRVFMIVLFSAKDDGVNEVLTSRINATSKIYVTGTRWMGRTAARIAVSNWQVRVEDDFELIRTVLEDVVKQ